MTFSVSTTLETTVSESSLRSTRQTIESELGDIVADVDGGGISSQLSRDVEAMADGGSDTLDVLETQTEVLEDVRDVLEQSAVSGGGIGGGGGGGGGILGNLLPGDGGGSGLISGLVGGGLALKAKDLLKVGGKLPLSAPQVLAVGGALTLTAAGVIEVKERYELPGRELLAVGSVLTLGAGTLLGVTGALSVPAAAVIGVTGAITLAVSEIVKLLPEGPGNVKTDGITDSTKPGATEKTRVQDIGSFINNDNAPKSASEVTDFLQDAAERGPVQGPGVDVNRSQLRQSQPIRLDVNQRIDIEDSRKLEQRLEKLKEELKREINRELNTDATL
jgi:hypothetical protein